MLKFFPEHQKFDLPPIPDPSIVGKINFLRNSGITVDLRDPKMNSAFKGKFMICNPLEEGDPYPTEDASDGRFCIVGNDLPSLLDDAISLLDDTIILHS